MDRRDAHPFRQFVDEMNRMRELGMRGYEPGHILPGGTDAAWIPAADVFARERDLVIRVALAGIRRDDVDLTFAHGVLTISGERGRDQDEEGAGFFAREIFYGPFERRVRLPEGARADEISAAFEDGMLEITIRGAFATASPKEPRRIPIEGDPTGA